MIHPPSPPGHRAPPTARVSAAELGELVRSHGDVRVLDVRTPGEFETAHIAGAYNIPLDELPDALDELRDVSARVVVVCQSGARADRACTVLDDAGIAGVELLHGGMAAWQRAGEPVRAGRSRWALERQVRLVAGALVLGSVVAGIVTPRARVLTAAVGSGLVVAALTDTCAMGRLLSRLPYNRGRARSLDARLTARLLRTGAPTPGQPSATSCPAA